MATNLVSSTKILRKLKKTGIRSKSFDTTSKNSSYPIKIQALRDRISLQDVQKNILISPNKKQEKKDLNQSVLFEKTTVASSTKLGKIHENPYRRSFKSRNNQNSYHLSDTISNRLSDETLDSLVLAKNYKNPYNAKLPKLLKLSNKVL